MQKCCLLVQVMFGGWPEHVKNQGPSRYGPRAAHWIAIAETDSLAELLSRPDYVVPGVPVFFVVVKGSDFETRFLADEIPLL